MKIAMAISAFCLMALTGCSTGPSAGTNSAGGNTGNNANTSTNISSTAAVPTPASVNSSPPDASARVVSPSYLTFHPASANSSPPGASADMDSAAAQEAVAPASGQQQVSLRRNFYFVFDGSGSMKDQPRGASSADKKRFDSKIQGAKWAVTEFLTKIPDDVNLGLYVFDAGGRRQVLPLGPHNRAQFLADVKNIRAQGATPLGAAISRGADELEKQYQRQLGYGDFRLIVITDGEATDRLESGVAMAARYHIPIYTIGFDMGEEHALRKHSVSYRSADSASDVEHALEEAGAELDVFDPPAFSAAKSAAQHR